ncbi:MAG: adenylyl-sulfate reductase subunit alpha [Treponemataceae bacterium]|nr:adenylyl-sulfate reductase subunit alpha [Treponemataceae bacterium]
MKIEKIVSDVLIIGGGTAGCYAAIKLAENNPDLNILIVEKANIKRSGCLAAGVNALNAYISEGHVPQDYVNYASNDANGIVRTDLLLSMSENLNDVTHDLEKRGLVILKDENGKYVTRGWRNLKINGENIKLILANGVKQHKNIQVLNHVNVTDYKVTQVEKPGKRKIFGAYGFSVNENLAYDFSAKAVLIATGGAAGLYRPNNPGFSRHKMWYPPFNTGAGFSMGILAGAEMTSFEMRFIALRCKDTIAPTGTIAQGVHAKQVNSKGEVYETKYGLRTSERCWGTVEENRNGNGPCYLRTAGISSEQEQDLYKAYLNMAPSQTLKWLEDGKGPSSYNVEIEGTEPYIVGGHTASGYWISNDRQTTISGLFAAGDVAGGAPQKYVTGSLAEAKIAATGILEFLKNEAASKNSSADEVKFQVTSKATSSVAPFSEYEKHFSENTLSTFEADEIEEAMQKIMDEYAGGIKTDYRYNEMGLKIAKQKILDLKKIVPQLKARDMDDLLRIYEIRERLIVCQVLIEHLLARKETRWHSFGENTDYSEINPQFKNYINSVMDENGEIHIILRDLV